MASSAGCTRNGVKTRPPSMPAAVPASVSTMRPVAAALPPSDRMSMALIGTSRMWSPRRSTYPTARLAGTRIARLHQVNPATADSATATTTPATTLTTGWTALRSVWYMVTCTTSNAVSGASTGVWWMRVGRLLRHLAAAARHHIPRVGSFLPSLSRGAELPGLMMRHRGETRSVGRSGKGSQRFDRAAAVRGHQEDRP